MFFLANLGLINHQSLSQSNQDFEVLFKRLYAPPSRSRMSNIFRASEFLGQTWNKPFFLALKTGIYNLAEKLHKLQQIQNCNKAV